MKYMYLLLMLNVFTFAMERYPNESKKIKSKDVVIDMHRFDTEPEHMSEDSDSLQNYLKRSGFRGMTGKKESQVRQWGNIFKYPDLMRDFALLLQSPHNSQMEEQEKNYQQQRLQLKIAAITFLGVIVAAIPAYIQLFQGDQSCNCTG
jgi:hypothetical protein